MKSRRTNEEDSAKCHKAKEVHLLLTHTTQTNVHKHFLAASLLPCLLVKTTQEGLNPDLWHSAFHSQTDQSTLTDTNSCTRLTALVTDRRKETKTTVQRRRSGIRKKEEGVFLH